MAGKDHLGCHLASADLLLLELVAILQIMSMWTSAM